jgi:3-phenylpropionate/trans-cinnamate dioxygenase ferredoxin reductase component
VTTREHVVIVGGGPAAAGVVEGYRGAGGERPVTVVSADRHPPYRRPPLSKALLRGETQPDDILLAPVAAYAERDAELRLETAATGLDLERQEVLVGDGRLPFGQLVIATGSRPRRLQLPGFELDGVHVLRTLDDALAIREQAQAGARAVVVGAGFIGLEVASSLRTLGVDVAVLASGSAILAAVASPELSRHLARRAEEEGVQLLVGDSPVRFEGDGRLERIVMATGRELAADLAVVGAGVELSLDWLDGSGLAVDDGIAVDERFRTPIPRVHAVGDVAHFYDPVLERRRRIEHWSNADYHGKQLGALLAGEEAPYDRVSSFFTEIFGRGYRVLGDTTGADQRHLDGSFDDAAAVLYYLEQGRVRGALYTGQTEEQEEELRGLIRAGGVPA